jgi:hypothetical protein
MRAERRPSPRRRFAGKTFNRLASAIPGPRQRLALSSLAARARRAGYNARIVLNKGSTSVYIRPSRHRYNRIPETDPQRQAVFPTSFRLAAGVGGAPTREADADISTRFPTIVAEQVAEIQGELNEARRLQTQLDEMYDELEGQGRQALKSRVAEAHALSIGITPSEQFISNLSESQWELIENQPQLQGREPAIEKQTRHETARALGEITLLNGGESSMQGLYYQLSSGGLVQLFDADSSYPIRTFSPEFVSDVEGRMKDEMRQLWRLQFTDAMNELGFSEHSIFAGLTADPLRDEISSIKESLDWRDWPGTPADLTPEDDNDAALNALLEEGIQELADQEDAAAAASEAAAQRTSEALNQDVPARELTLGEVRGFLRLAGWDRREENDNGHTGANERRGERTIVLRSNENEGDAPAGYTWVRRHLRRLRADARDLTAAWVEHMDRVGYTNWIEGEEARVIDGVAATGVIRAALLPPDHPERIATTTHIHGLMGAIATQGLADEQPTPSESELGLGSGIHIEGPHGLIPSAIRGEASQDDWDGANTFEELARTFPATANLVHQLEMNINARMIGEMDRETFKTNISVLIDDISSVMAQTAPHRNWRSTREKQMIDDWLTDDTPPFEHKERYWMADSDDSNYAWDGETLTIFRERGSPRVVSRRRLMELGVIEYEPDANPNVYLRRPPTTEGRKGSALRSPLRRGLVFDEQRRRMLKPPGAEESRWINPRSPLLQGRRHRRRKQHAARFIYHTPTRTASTHQLFEYLNSDESPIKNGVSMSVLTNILSSDKRFRKAGTVKVAGLSGGVKDAELSGGYEVVLWGLSEPVDEVSG